MSHYFQEPNSFRIVNCKRVPGERARKHCREWNSFVKQRSKLIKAGLVEEANNLEQKFFAKLEAREEQRLASRIKQKRK